MCRINNAPIKIYYFTTYPLLLDFNPRFWHSLCTYALSTEVNDEGNSNTETNGKKKHLKSALQYNNKVYLCCYLALTFNLNCTTLIYCKLIIIYFYPLISFLFTLRAEPLLTSLRLRIGIPKIDTLSLAMLQGHATATYSLGRCTCMQLNLPGFSRVHSVYIQCRSYDKVLKVYAKVLCYSYIK